ncbi:hypothetical protein [Neorhizobium sp. NCHU2750]|uniref:hypothetical protein n=1 Tax=Neorhizobium sp. NCHU2750 TaxID=1825976 RepID=UPI000EB6B882|nr:hypothetical protein NCHU2750_06280 [Neorhizobium sp. NCHU2750]
MARVTFKKDFDYKPVHHTTIGYKAGWTGTVRRECADAAVAAGAAEEIDKDAPSTEQA